MKASVLNTFFTTLSTRDAALNRFPCSLSLCVCVCERDGEREMEIPGETKQKVGESDSKYITPEVDVDGEAMA